ncbi:hypothetical protein BV25DRAFT_286076 [Artomyces pyxidatus]|uniref:Uncharacterized protein n=1 Tax=Artomyces pyxidatus TaxID=48021 RepID=A0ACB8SH90_9AGAM|nr:hypothetical protein BV25DRAFT_286076 [Artomyces pyxidatus]
MQMRSAHILSASGYSGVDACGEPARAPARRRHKVACLRTGSRVPKYPSRAHAPALRRPSAHPRGPTGTPLQRIRAPLREEFRRQLGGRGGPGGGEGTQRLFPSGPPASCAVLRLAEYWTLRPVAVRVRARSPQLARCERRGAAGISRGGSPWAPRSRRLTGLIVRVRQLAGTFERASAQAEPRRSVTSRGRATDLSARAIWKRNICTAARRYWASPPATCAATGTSYRRPHPPRRSCSRVPGSEAQLGCCSGWVRWICPCWVGATTRQRQPGGQRILIGGGSCAAVPIAAPPTIMREPAASGRPLAGSPAKEQNATHRLRGPAHLTVFVPPPRHAASL